MKVALLASNGVTVALASRLIAGGVKASTVTDESSLEGCDWFLFEESIPLSSKEQRSETKKLIGSALLSGKPTFAYLTPNAPATPKCAVVMNELLSFSSAAAVTPSGATDILGVEIETISEEESEANESQALDARLSALARTLCETYEWTFALVFDPDEGRGVIFADGAYDVIIAQSMENAIAEVFQAFCHGN